MYSIPKKIIFCYSLTIILTFLLAINNAIACDIAVVSSKASANGRPFIWKNRDNSMAWQQEIGMFNKNGNTKNPDAGKSVRVIDRTRVFVSQSGGVNESGFGIANTTCYQQSPIHEYMSSANLNIMSVALQECTTIEEFDDYIANWNQRQENWYRIVSGNFVVIDANGGAALYELSTGLGVNAYGGKIMVHKIDANTGFVTNEYNSLIGNNGEIGYLTNYLTGERIQIMDEDRNIINNSYNLSVSGNSILNSDGEVIDSGNKFCGFVNRTNSSFWVHLHDDTPRELRARALLQELQAQNKLTYRNVIQTIARDFDIEEDEDLNNLNTFYDINRYCTNTAFAVDGVAPGDDPKLATLWANLGEPALGVATPYFPASNDLSEYAWSDFYLFNIFPLDLSATCLLNKMIADKELEVYENNGNDSMIPPPTPEITQSLLSDLLQINLLLPYDERWDEFENALSDWHVAYMNYLIGFDEMDKTINYIKLLDIQEWTIPLEDSVMDNAESLIQQMREDSFKISPEILGKLSEYCGEYVYNNYSNESAVYQSWDFENPWKEESKPDPQTPWWKSLFTWLK